MRNVGNMQVLAMGTVSIPENAKQVNVVFEDCLETDRYHLQFQMYNDKDKYPQMFGPLMVIAKNSYGFQVELPHAADSPNYQLSYLVWGIVPIIPHIKVDIRDFKDAKHEYMDKVVSAPCNHKWKRYTGLMDSFDYCEICDEKRK